MYRKSFQHKSLILLASSALALLVCAETLTPSAAFASALSYEETILRNKLVKTGDDTGKKYSMTDATAEVLRRRAQASGGGGVNSEEKAKLEKKVEEAEKNLALERDQSLKLQQEKEKVEKERLQLEASQRAFEEQIAKQRDEHEKTLRELEAKHFKLTAAAKKKTAELEQELKLAAEASEFRGFEYLNKRLSVVDIRIKTLESMVTPEQPDMQEFIDHSKDALAKLTAEASHVDIGTNKDILLDLQKNISVFSFNFEIEALDFISRNAAKLGIDIPDGFYDMDEVQQKSALANAKELIETKIKEDQDAKKALAEHEKLLREKLKTHAEEELEIMKREVGDTPYLVKALTGTGILSADYKKMEQYAHADDYNQVEYPILKLREEEIGKVKPEGKGDEGTIIKSFRKNINALHEAQHPVNVTQEQTAFAEALYFKLPGEARKPGGLRMPGGLGGPPPPPPPPSSEASQASSSNGGRTPPPPPPPSSSNSGDQDNKFVEGTNYKTEYDTRLKSYTMQMPGMPALLAASPEELYAYRVAVIKSNKSKLKLFEDFVGTIKATGEKEHPTISLEGGKPEILEDIRKIMDGSIEPEKLYGYYLMLSALKGTQQQFNEIQLKWQKDSKSNLRSLKSFINYVKTSTIDPELEKASSSGSSSNAEGKPSKSATPKNDIFAHLDSLTEAWQKDKDFLKIASAEDAGKLSEKEGGFQKISTFINNFIAAAYGINDLGKINKMLASIPVEEHDSPDMLFAKLKKALTIYIGDLTVDGHKLEDRKGSEAPDIDTLIKPKSLKPDDYKALMILLSHFLDEERFINDLNHIEEQLKSKAFPSSIALREALDAVLHHDIDAITGPTFIMDTLSPEGEYHFNIPNNTFTPIAVSSKFDEKRNDLKMYEAPLKKLYSDYAAGKTIFPPSPDLVLVTNPKLKKITTAWDRTPITMDAQTITAIQSAMNEISAKLIGDPGKGIPAENKIFQATVKKLQSEYPKLAKANDLKALANLVEQAVDTVQLIDMKTIIPPEKQGRNVPYTYLKTFLMLKAFSAVVWKIEEPKPQAPIISSGGGQVAASSSGGHPGNVSQPSSSSGGHPSVVQPPKLVLKSVAFDALIHQYEQLELEIQHKEHTNTPVDNLKLEAQQYKAEIDKRQAFSAIQVWDPKHPEHGNKKIVLLLKAGEHLSKSDEQEIVNFIKEGRKDHRIVPENTIKQYMALLQKYQPHLLAELQ